MFAAAHSRALSTLHLEDQSCACRMDVEFVLFVNEECYKKTLSSTLGVFLCVMMVSPDPSYCAVNVCLSTVAEFGDGCVKLQAIRKLCLISRAFVQFFGAYLRLMFAFFCIVNGFWNTCVLHEAD